MLRPPAWLVTLSDSEISRGRVLSKPADSESDPRDPNCHRGGGVRHWPLCTPSSKLDSDVTRIIRPVWVSLVDASVEGPMMTASVPASD
jgi:hypothetical protein